jgi:uncharacterized protein (TIGR03663 family)
MISDQKRFDKSLNWAFLVTFAVAIVYRFWALDLKPPHFDEGINGWFTDQLISRGFYNYDPTNYHGPLHFYILMITKLLFGRNLWALRLSASAFGLASVWILWRLQKYFGKRTALLSVVFMALSPAMIFYARYAIHETELLFFSLLCFWGFLKHTHERDVKSLWMMGLGLAGMIVTKETFIVHVGTFFIAWQILKVWERFFPSTEKSFKMPAKNYSSDQLATVIFICSLIVIILYTGFFLDDDGLQNMFKSFSPWLNTGGAGNGHQKPFGYWFNLMGNYEWAAVFGLIFTLRYLWKSSRWLRLTAIYGFGVWLAYSIIPYKTPWCVIQILWPFFILAGAILTEFFEGPKLYRGLVVATVIIFSVNAGARSIELNFKKFDDESEPYVYVQTYRQLTEVLKPLFQAVEADPRLRHQPVVVSISSDWPLPWILGDFTKVGYFGGTVPTEPNGILVMTDLFRRAQIEKILTKKYFIRIFKLRSAKDRSIAYYEYEKFKSYFPVDSEVFEPLKQKAANLKPGAGLLARFYESAEWNGKPAYLEVFEKLDKVWSNEQRPMPPPFGVVFEGDIKIPKSGNIQFTLSSDDGSDLWIDNQNVINHLGAHPEQAKAGSIRLKEGWHKIQVRYNDYGGDMVIKLLWSLDGGQSSVAVPSEAFRHSGGRF